MTKGSFCPFVHKDPLKYNIFINNAILRSHRRHLAAPTSSTKGSASGGGVAAGGGTGLRADYLQPRLDGGQAGRPPVGFGLRPVSTIVSAFCYTTSKHRREETENKVPPIYDDDK
ncbi:uncharacterized protein LOC106135804 [Amyelois transitella]|uniref:uncharacterized protein LOC106135804 n=1 Tax=Amyelois transitella TaxID=680683 RepID=UPI00298F6ADF|nr:uncharacterized protein LOC106135804 [Amyelois transitella]